MEPVFRRLRPPGGLVVANLSGFALYTAASSTLAAVTGTLGLTLPFAVYTGMSSVIATLTGPVGWVALGLFVAAKAGGPNYGKTIPSVLAIATTRARLTAEHATASTQLRAEAVRNEFEQRRLEEMEAFLRRYAGQPPTVGVPRSSVPR